MPYCYGSNKEEMKYCPYKKDCECELLDCTTLEENMVGKVVYIMGQGTGICLRDDKE